MTAVKGSITRNDRKRALLGKQHEQKKKRNRNTALDIRKPRKRLPIQPPASEVDSSTFNFGHIHCCRRGVIKKIETKWQTM